MTIVVLLCPEGNNLVLAVNTETKQLIGYCRKCNRWHHINDINVKDEDIVRVEKSMFEVGESSKRGEAMFYTRCTELLHSIV